MKLRRLLIAQLTFTPQTQNPQCLLGALTLSIPLVAKRRQIPRDIIVGVLGIVGEVWAMATIAAAGALLGESYLIIIPTFVFALLLIRSRVFKCQEGKDVRSGFAAESHC